MAKFSTKELGRLELDFEKLASIPESVIDEMVLAQGKVIRDGQAREAERMLQGPYYKGAVARAIKVGKIKKTADGKAVYVVFEGKQHGNNIAEIAFVNEYGKKNQPPRPFIATANKKNAEAAVDAAAKVYDEYLKKHNL